MLPSLPRSTLFPYTTLFRSAGMLRDGAHYLGTSRTRFSLCQLDAATLPFRTSIFDAIVANMMFYHVDNRRGALEDIRRVLRSEEHTSELQSRFDLVCRLLLE